MRPPISALSLACLLTLAPLSARADVHWITPTIAELQMTAEPKAPGAPAIILSYEETDDGSSAEVTVHVRIKVLTSGGISAGTLELPSRVVRNDDFEQLFAARTIHADGTILPFTGKPTETTTAAGGRDIVRKVLALPDVQVGSIVEYQYHFASQNTVYTYLIGAYAPTWRVQREYFVRAAHFTLRTPDSYEPETTRWVANLPPGAALNRDKKAIHLDMSDIPALPDEEFMPPASTLVYNVRFFYYSGTRDHYWARTGNDVDDNWEQFDQPRKALVAVVNTLIQPGDDDEHKLRKIYAAVQKLENTDFTREHSAREDKAAGLHEAKNSEDIWNRKRGDSDDMTHLFIALTRAAGYKAYPMAVASRDHAIFDQNVLSWMQMDSMIAIVEVGGTEKFFDPGTRLCPFGRLAPWHSNVIGVSTEAKLVKIRSTPTEPFTAARTERLAELTLAPDGSVTGAVKMAWTGTAGLSLREQGLRSDEREVKTNLEKRIQGQLPSGLEVHLKSLNGLDDGEVPLIAEFTVSGTLGAATSKRIVVPAQLFASAAKPMLAPETRTAPLNFPDAYVTRDQIVLHLPAELTVESLPAAQTLSVGTDTAYAAGAQAAPKDPHMLVAQRTFLINRIDYKPEDYSALHKYFGHVADSDQQQIVLHRAETAAH